MSLLDANSREDLFDELKFDRAKPAEAEAEATRRGWAPLAPEPDIAAYDPLAEQQWTFPMAMAWISMRSVDAVRLAWNKYRARYPIWRRGSWRDGPGGEVHRGWLLYHLEPATSLGLELLAIVGGMEEDGKPAVMSVADARDALWSILQEGLLPATGVARTSGSRTLIPASEWHALEPHFSDHRDEVGRAGGSADYVDPLLPSKGVRHLWGPRREAVILPPLVPPEGDGYIPLGCAAQWIATEGGTIDFDPSDNTVWGPAFEQLLGAVASEKVRVVGLKSGARERVSGYHFAGCRVDYPFAESSIDLILSDTVYLRCYPYIDEEHWRNGFDDALISRHKDHWTQLMVEKGDVRERWPFQSLAPMASGAPGRPTSMHLVVAELDRRAGNGEMKESVVAESKDLSQWLAKVHADKPQAKPKAIETGIRARHRELRSQK